MGQKVFGANSRIRDDLVLLTPDFPVHLTRSDYESGRTISGGFDILTNPEKLQRPNSTSHSPYYYYLEDNITIELENNDINDGSLLVIKDSFSNAMLPFLSLAAGHITAWDMREEKQKRLHISMSTPTWTYTVFYLYIKLYMYILQNTFILFFVDSLFVCLYNIRIFNSKPMKRR